MSIDDNELSLRQDIEDALIQASDCVNDSTKWWDVEEKGPRLIETLIGMIVVAAKEHSNAISEHHAKCIEALQRIALLADTGSNVYRNRFYDTVMADVGWRVAEAMREIANDVVGNLPLSPIFDETHTSSRA